MGCYLTPNDGETKERWLRRNGTPLPAGVTFEWTDLPTDILPVVLVGNSAKVAYGPVEFKRLMDDTIDRRKKQWYLVDTQDLLTHSNLNTFWKGLQRQVSP